MPAKRLAHRLAAERYLLFGAAIVLLAGALVWWAVRRATSTAVDVEVPELSPVAQAGQEAFQKHCAMCHAPKAGGTEQGPPLIHRLYVPGHHARVAENREDRRGEILATFQANARRRWNRSTRYAHSSQGSPFTQ
jgi:hypothetical protein